MAGHLSGRKNPRFIPMEGKIFGMLTVVGFSHIGRQAKWDCLCECGRVVKVDGSCLRSGNTKSCGCLRYINAGAAARLTNRTHGMCNTRTYETWQSIIRRCDDPSHKSYKNYGGRGIKICDAWRNFSAFYADMGERPLGKTIERVDNSRGYEPGNCEWRTAREQARNRRSGKHITAYGETKLLVEWEEDPRCVVWRDTLCYRLSKGWSPESAISTHPLRRVASKRGIKASEIAHA